MDFSAGGRAFLLFPAQVLPDFAASSFDDTEVTDPEVSIATDNADNSLRGVSTDFLLATAGCDIFTDNIDLFLQDLIASFCVMAFF